MCDIFSFFEFKVRTCSFGKKNRTDQLISLYKMFLFYDDNENELHDHMITMITCKNVINQSIFQITVLLRITIKQF